NGCVNVERRIHRYIRLYISARIKVVQDTYQRSVYEGARRIIWGRCAFLMRVPGTSCRFQYLGGIPEEPDVQPSPQPDKLQFRVLGEQMPQVIEQAEMIDGIRRIGPA